MSESEHATTARKMPWWGWVGWAVLLLQLLGHAVAFDGTSGVDVTPAALVVAILALAVGISGIVAMLAGPKR